MLTTVVITVFGPDRAGLVEAVSSRTTAAGGNWLESRMLNLGGHFAGIVRIEIEEEKRDELLASLNQLHAEGLQVVAHDAGTDARGTSGEGHAAVVEVVGHDRRGIVKEISHVLAAHGVNVEELSSERMSAPMTGEPIFKARARVLVPKGLDAAVLQAELEKIASDLMVDLTFQADPA